MQNRIHACKGESLNSRDFSLISFLAYIFKSTMSFGVAPHTKHLWAEASFKALQTYNINDNS